ncbi:enterobactin synthetase component E [includes: 2,3-dihydroxybenzoate-AMP ligase; S-dihydroxybenzoyltransferase] [Escherichia coli]|uniref:Enterobactin synthetase component E [includes: 2,3-dihydroxybenzoate-AMP ligase S-dihydroxybenzoyltransferase] n=1 Tax=Escherichia coli TaxID=562 RepID=A0A2X3KGN4_ECOLX|nr:enterobactin synthetase component E [includes: 2,3-dihydroxybenzoate-AMP ligase; S-dihydroxybenzoyltransferase] [Escherichia coli]
MKPRWYNWGNVAELYITFFALLKLGVAPVLALFSHQRSELNAMQPD